MAVVTYEPHTRYYDDNRYFQWPPWKLLGYRNKHPNIHVFKPGTPVRSLPSSSMPTTPMTTRSRKRTQTMNRRGRNAKRVRTVKSSYKKNLFGKKKTVGAKKYKRMGYKYIYKRKRRSANPAPPGAFYGGKWSRAMAAVKQPMDVFNKTGVVLNSETIGSDDDQDCVYIMAEVVNTRSLIRQLCAAMLRTLIEKAGMRVEGPDCCPFDVDSSAANEALYNITLVFLNTSSGVFTNQDLNCSANQTFSVIVTAFEAFFQNYSAGYGVGNVNNPVEPYRFTLWQGATDRSNAVILSNMLMTETYVDVSGYSELKVQNRTQSSALSNDIEQVGNNPLQGFCYEFKGIPRAKGNGAGNDGAGVTLKRWWQFQKMDFNRGIRTWGSADGGASETCSREPPNPRQFYNCVSASKIRLDPGQIKKMSGHFQKSANVLKLLKTVRYQTDASGDLLANYSIFPVHLIALEDVINADVAAKITLQYELERKLGVKCYTKAKKYYATEVTTTI